MSLIEFTIAIISCVSPQSTVHIKRSLLYVENWNGKPLWLMLNTLSRNVRRINLHPLISFTRHYINSNAVHSVGLRQHCLISQSDCSRDKLWRLKLVICVLYLHVHLQALPELFISWRTIISLEPAVAATALHWTCVKLGLKLLKIRKR